MYEKICTQCKLIKTFDNFCRDNSKSDNYYSSCKLCNLETDHIRNKKYRTNNKKKIQKKRKLFYKNNPTYNSTYYKINKEKIDKNHSQYKIKNFKKIKLYLKIYQKSYRLKNHDSVNIKNREYENFKYCTDINFRLKKNLRNRLNSALKYNSKSKRTLELLGCSLEFLKQHLEKQFKVGMSWLNYGKWEIDHIRPCALFNLSNSEEQKKCFHYTNLQPLWAKENLSKGSKYVY